MVRALAVAAMIGGFAGPAGAQGVTFGGGPTPREYSYPANPQYQYPYPYDDSRAKADRRCPRGTVRHQGRCKVARPLALPF